MPLSLVVALFLASAVVGVWSAETGRRPLHAVFKPLTTLLLLLVVGWPRGRFSWLVDAGIVFSLIGDVALLGTTDRMFLVGLGAFLIAHLLYTTAFLLASWGSLAAGAAGPWAATLGGMGLMAVVTVVLLRKLWPGTAGLRAPLVGYASALALTMVSAVIAAAAWKPELGLGVYPAAAAGAALFYTSDASLALDRFVRPIKHARILTLGLYWLGQLGICLAARLGSS